MTTIKKEQTALGEKTTYMELVGSNRVTYRVTSAVKEIYGERITTYGIEADMRIGPVRFCEKIDDFSEDVMQAAGFAELLCENHVKPSLIYNAALCYLRKTI